MGKYKEYRLNLEEIRASLTDVQRNFARLSEEMLMRREPLDDRIIDNLLAGYAYVDQLLEDKVDLFTLKGSDHILELNHIVLCAWTSGCAWSSDRISWRRASVSVGASARYWPGTRRKSPSPHTSGPPGCMCSGQPAAAFPGGQPPHGALLASYILSRTASRPLC